MTRSVPELSGLSILSAILMNLLVTFDASSTPPSISCLLLIFSRYRSSSGGLAVNSRTVVIMGCRHSGVLRARALGLFPKLPVRRLCRRASQYDLLIASSTGLNFLYFPTPSIPYQFSCALSYTHTGTTLQSTSFFGFPYFPNSFGCRVQSNLNGSSPYRHLQISIYCIYGIPICGVSYNFYMHISVTEIVINTLKQEM